MERRVIQEYFKLANFRVKSRSITPLITGSHYFCADVDCGSLPEVTNGQVQYTNKTTHLGSTAVYNCHANYRLEGSSQPRVCTEEGKWSGVAPHCREIRCPLPERIDGAVLSISSSDRLRAVTLLRNTDRGGEGGSSGSVTSTFRIGSTVIYKCERGYKLDGRNSRVCDEAGQWTGEVPTCTCKCFINGIFSFQNSNLAVISQSWIADHRKRLFTAQSACRTTLLTLAPMPNTSAITTTSWKVSSGGCA